MSPTSLDSTTFELEVEGNLAKSYKKMEANLAGYELEYKYLLAEKVRLEQKFPTD